MTPNFPDNFFVNEDIIIIEGLDDYEINNLIDNSYTFDESFKRNVETGYFLLIEEVRGVRFYRKAKPSGEKRAIALKKRVGSGFGILGLK